MLGKLIIKVCCVHAITKMESINDTLFCNNGKQKNVTNYY